MMTIAQMQRPLKTSAPRDTRRPRSFAAMVNGWLRAALGRRRVKPVWQDTVPNEADRVQPPQRITPVMALTQALNKTADSRATLKNLLIVEQTLSLASGKLDHVPLAILQKALLEIRVLGAGTRGSNAGLRTMKDQLKAQIARTDLRHFIDKTRGTINWGHEVGTMDSDFAELQHGELVDTSRRAVDVPVPFERTVLAGLDDGEGRAS